MAAGRSITTNYLNDRFQRGYISFSELTGEVIMMKNIGRTDKIIRVSLAILLILCGIIFNIWWLFLIALIPFLTAFIEFCPLYPLFRINTNKERKLQVKLGKKTKTH